MIDRTNLEARGMYMDGNPLFLSSSPCFAFV